ncbi:DUF4097 family beta strand repeat protein [PVC group bacterium]|nr:DUF4097 family beta strand repeat protein [PVC group bacterium]
MTRLRFIAILLFPFSAIGCSNMHHVPDWQLVLNTSGPVAVDVDSFSGDITITADRTSVDTIINFHRSSSRESDQNNLYRFISYTAETRPTEIGQEVVVKATAIHNELDLLRVDIAITTNSVENVNLRTRNGSVTLLGVGGKLDVRTADGDIHVSTNEPMTKPVLLENHRGNIVYRVSQEATGIVEVSAIGGRAGFDALLGNTTLLPGSTTGFLNATLNDGRNEVVLRTVDGDAVVEVVENPMIKRHNWNLDWLPF